MSPPHAAPGNFDPPLIHLGTPHESPTYLTREDWRVHGEDGWSDHDAGHWEIHLARPGPYTVTLRFTPLETDAVTHLQFSGAHLVQHLQKAAASCTFENVPGNIGPGRIEAWLTTASQKLSPLHRGNCPNIWAPHGHLQSSLGAAQLAKTGITE